MLEAYSSPRTVDDVEIFVPVQEAMLLWRGGSVNREEVAGFASSAIKLTQINASYKQKKLRKAWVLDLFPLLLVQT